MRIGALGMITVMPGPMPELMELIEALVIVARLAVVGASRERDGSIASLPEVLGERRHPVIETVPLSGRTDLDKLHPRNQVRNRAGRVGAFRKGVAKHKPFFGQRVHERGRVARIAVRTEIGRTRGIEHDDDHVGRWIGRRTRD